MNVFKTAQNATKELSNLIDHEIYVLYSINNKSNGKIYYGITKNIDWRTNNHVTALKNTNHTSKELQKDFNKLGHEAFSVKIIDFIFGKEVAKELEKELINKSELCYNVMMNTHSKQRNNLIANNAINVNREALAEGRERAKRAGKHLGRPAQPKKKVKQALELYDNREINKLSVADIVKTTGVPRSTIYHELKKRTPKK